LKNMPGHGGIHMPGHGGIPIPPWPGIFFKPARCGYTLRVTSHKHLMKYFGWFQNRKSLPHMLMAFSGENKVALESPVGSEKG
jgi:hypothetical protein